MKDKVSKNTVVTIHYTLTDNDGNKLDSSVGDEPMEYLHGHNQIIKGLSDAMQGRKVGEKFSVTIPSGKAYGAYKKNLVFVLDRDKIKGEGELTVGTMMELSDSGGHPVPVTVTDISGDKITVDANHPMAGKTLNFDVEVIAVREATKEELSHGHAHHGDGCC